MSVPQIFDRNMKRLAYLDNAISVGYTLELNSIWTATFTMPADDPKNKYCEPLNFVEIYDGNERIDLFRIIGEDLERADGATRFYNCEHVLATLLNDVLFKYHQCGGYGITTAAVLNYVLARQTTQHWKLGACDFSRNFEYNWENSTLLAALFAVPECFDSEYKWEWDTTVYPWTLSLVSPTDELKSEIRYAKNMTSIVKTQDATALANRVYALGYGEGVNQLTIESVNNGVPYVEDAMSILKYGLCSTILVDSRYEVPENLKAYATQILAELKEPYISYEIGAIDLHRLTGDSFSKFRPGEVVRVVDEADGVNLRTRIVTVTKDDAQGDPGNVTVTIANKTQDIAGSISDLQSRALIGETYAQGATNQQVYNFSDNADETHPATMKIYIDESVVRINKMLLNIQFEPFRAFEKAIGGGGGQTTSSGGGSTTSSGGGSTTSSGGGSTTSSGGGQTSSATALESSNVLPNETTGQAVHDHGIDYGEKIAIANDELKVVKIIHWVPSGAHIHPEHTHIISDHTHKVDAHTHRVSAHTHTVPEHTHTVQNHTHEIQFGIYEGSRASRATIKVDGNVVPTPEHFSDIDIVAYLAKDDRGKITRNAWHTVEILPDTMSRIVGAVFAQTFCNSRGGGDY
jgi:phage minor structural protein